MKSANQSNCDFQQKNSGILCIYQTQGQITISYIISSTNANRVLLLAGENSDVLVTISHYCSTRDRVVQMFEVDISISFSDSVFIFDQSSSAVLGNAPKVTFGKECYSNIPIPPIPNNQSIKELPFEVEVCWKYAETNDRKKLIGNAPSIFLFNVFINDKK